MSIEREQWEQTIQNIANEKRDYDYNLNQLMEKFIGQKCAVICGLKELRNSSKG